MAKLETKYARQERDEAALATRRALEQQATLQETHDAMKESLQSEAKARAAATAAHKRAANQCDTLQVRAGVQLLARVAWLPF